MYQSKEKTIVGIDTIRNEIISRAKPSTIIFYVLAAILIVDGLAVLTIVGADITLSSFEWSDMMDVLGVIGSSLISVFFIGSGCFIATIVIRRSRRYKSGEMNMVEDVVESKILPERALCFQNAGKYVVKSWENHNIDNTDVNDEFYIVYLEKRIIRVYNKKTFQWK